MLQTHTMSLADIVAQNLLTSRNKKNLTQAALAKKAKVSVSYVSMLERGARTPPLDTLEILAKALAVSPLDLLQAHAAKATKVSRRARR